MTSFLAEYERRLAGPWSDIQDQLALLYDRACRYPEVQVAEFGVRTGESTAAFLAAAELTGGGHVHSWDTADPRVPAWWHDSPLWTFTRQDSAAADIPGLVDVLFIDTSHDYQATLGELDRHAHAVRSGGLILLHDTKLADPPFDPLAVARALDAWCPPRGLEWDELGGHYGLGQITIP
jgi:predicted O-methyltransferase YrrM